LHKATREESGPDYLTTTILHTIQHLQETHQLPPGAWKFAVQYPSLMFRPLSVCFGSLQL